MVAYDEASGGVNSVFVRGWAFDPDTPNESVKILVYVNGEYVGSGIANTERTDVNAAYGCGNYHGYEITLPVSVPSTGTYSVQLYAVNTDEESENKDLGQKEVTITAAAKIVTQPISVNVVNGATAKASVTAVGDGLTYQWYYTSNGSTGTFMKSSNTTATYSTTMNASRAGRKVYCVVTDQHGNTAKSNTVTLGMKVSIGKQPASVTVPNGVTAQTTVNATGEGLKYQWYFTSNGNTGTFMKSSNTTATYSTTMDATRAGRKVYCVITDKYGNSVTTKTVTLGMLMSITKLPTSVTVANGATAKTSVSVTGEGLKYQWYYTSGGSSTTFMKSSFTSATYYTTMDANRAGRKVFCVISDKYGNTVTTNTVTLGMKLNITKQPASVTVANGKTAATTVSASGEGLKYQWYYTANGSSSTFTKSSITSATYFTTMDAAKSGRRIYCVITDKYGNTVKTSTATLRMG